MKRKVIILFLSVVVIISLLTAGSLQKGSSKIKQDVNSPKGTWRLELYKYGEATSYFYNRQLSQPRIKLITDTYFTWVTIDTVTSRIIGAAGGTYSLSGNTYTESIDYSFNMDSYLKTKNVYKIKVEGDM